MAKKYEQLAARMDPARRARAEAKAWKTMSDYIDNCPHCGASLIGDEIPENRREMFGGKTHGSRAIAVYDRERDRTDHFKCPDCGGRIERDQIVKQSGSEFRTFDMLVPEGEGDKKP